MKNMHNVINAAAPAAIVFSLLMLSALTAAAQTAVDRVPPAVERVTDGERGVSGMISVYPNPFNDQLHVVMHGLDGRPMTIEMFDAQNGLPVLHRAITYNGPEHFDTSSLPYGYYLLRVTSPNGQYIAGREVKKDQVR